MAIIVNAFHISLEIYPFFCVKITKFKLSVSNV